MDGLDVGNRLFKVCSGVGKSIPHGERDRGEEGLFKICIIAWFFLEFLGW
jgi:hypothetical protein